MAKPMDSLSSLSSSSSSLPPNAFAQLVSTEKEHTRHWLRGEMISLVDPLIETLFDKLTSRFASCFPTSEELKLSSSASDVGGGGRNDDGTDDGQHKEMMMMMIPTHHRPITQHPLESLIEPPLPNTFYPLNSFQLSKISTNSHNTSFTNELIDDVIPFEPIKQNEIEPISKTTNEPIPEGQGKSWNEQNDLDEEKEECECDDCMNGGIAYIKLEDDDDDGILIDSDDDKNDGLSASSSSSSTHHPVGKKPRIEAITETQLQNKPKCTRQQPQTDPPMEQFSTLQLKCHLEPCPQLFTCKNELNSHMLRAHSVRQCRCLVKDCKQSFNNQSSLSRHIKKFHNQFPCHKCVKHFTTYSHLSVHNNLYHNLGLYGCSYPSCTFTGEFKQKVYSHYKTNHKAEVYCEQPDCDYRTTNRAKLKEHSRAHLGIKPYRCRWDNCGYANVRRYLTLNHIRTQHLVHHHHGSRNPVDFLEVVRDLLL